MSSGTRESLVLSVIRKCFLLNKKLMPMWCSLILSSVIVHGCAHVMHGLFYLLLSSSLHICTFSILWRLWLFVTSSLHKLFFFLQTHMSLSTINLDMPGILDPGFRHDVSEDKFPNSCNVFILYYLFIHRCFSSHPWYLFLHPKKQKTGNKRVTENFDVEFYQDKWSSERNIWNILSEKHKYYQDWRNGEKL